MARPEITGRKARQGAEAEVKLPSIRGPPATGAEAKAKLPSIHGSPAPIAVAAYSIPEFCFAHRISVDHYFKLQRLRLGPDVMKAGTRTLISVEAAARWREQREAAARESNKAKEENAEVA
jgi:hypothetical protein